MIKPLELPEKTRNQNAYDIGQHMRNQGWNDTAIFALLGNMDAESGLDPDLPQIGSGIGFGLVQFDGSAYPLIGAKTLVGREYVQRLVKWAGITAPYNTILAQCQLINYVMDHGQYIPTNAYPQTANEFRNWSGTLEDAVKAFMLNFERAGEERLDVRLKDAQNWANNLKLDENPPAPNDGSHQTHQPDVETGGEDETVNEIWVKHTKTEIEKIKVELDEGHYFLTNERLLLENNSFNMIRYNNDLFLHLDEKSKQVDYWTKEKNKNDDTKKNPPSPPKNNNDDEKPIVNTDLANQFMKRLDSMLNKGLTYDMQGPRDPESGVSADCSSFICWGLAPFHPYFDKKRLGYYGSTITISQALSANGYAVYEGYSRDDALSKLKLGYILVWGLPSLAASAGGNGHVMGCWGDENNTVTHCCYYRNGIYKEPISTAITYTSGEWGVYNPWK